MPQLIDWLQADVAKCIAPHFNNSRADLYRVAQMFVAPFSKEQTQVYVAPPARN